jgi:hypothetical protein
MSVVTVSQVSQWIDYKIGSLPREQEEADIDLSNVAC